MEKLVLEAIVKTQNREHLIRVAREQLALGRITREAYQAKVEQINNLYGLTLSEKRAYDLYLRMKGERRG